MTNIKDLRESAAYLMKFKVIGAFDRGVEKWKEDMGGLLDRESELVEYLREVMEGV